MATSSGASQSASQNSTKNTTIQLSDAGKNHCMFLMLDLIAKTYVKQSQMLLEVKGEVSRIKQAQKELQESLKTVSEKEKLNLRSVFMTVSVLLFQYFKLA